MYSAYDVFPEQLRDMPEFRSLELAANRQIKKLNARIDEMRDNILISTARESGIADREKTLGIVPLETDTLEERRYRVALRWYDTYPYTEADLRARLDRLCGKENYTLNLDKKKNTLTCMMPIASQKLVKETRRMLDEILSLNVALRAGMWRESAQTTYSGAAISQRKLYNLEATPIHREREVGCEIRHGAALARKKQEIVKEA